MTTFKKQMVAALSAGSMLFSVVSPVFAQTTLEISGNGTDSENKVTVSNTGSTTVQQSNNAIITNSVTSNTSTGNNEANKNTGGAVTVKTGDAVSSVNIDNMVNSNTAKVDCCSSTDAKVTVSGNGSDSENKVKLDTGKEINLVQNNDAFVTNDVTANVSTGSNEADKNTGGEVLVKTGDAKSTVSVSTTANANSAQVGGSSDHGTVSAVISGNGTDSENNVHLDLGGSTAVWQNNEAIVANAVKGWVDTGYNSADKNTGGMAAIVTGDAESRVMVDNMVNFNWANIDCGCTTDLTAKVAGNGYDSENRIHANLGGSQEVYQGGENGNLALLTNILGGNADTGYNEIDKTTGTPHGDPFVMTGDSASIVDVANSGNVNSYGVEPAVEWPSVEFNFSLNFAHLLSHLTF